MGSRRRLRGEDWSARRHWPSATASAHGPAVARIAFDAEAQEVAVTMSDGTELRAAMMSPHPWQDLRHADADLATRELTMRLRSGETLVVELGAGGEDDLPGPGR